jgi:hypothetical protein
MMGVIRTTRGTRVMVRRVTWVVRIVRMTWVVIMNRWRTVMSGVPRVTGGLDDVHTVMVLVGMGRVVVS